MSYSFLLRADRRKERTAFVGDGVFCRMTSSYELEMWRLSEVDDDQSTVWLEQSNERGGHGGDVIEVMIGLAALVVSYKRETEDADWRG